jgi:hypothetical protein
VTRDEDIEQLLAKLKDEVLHPDTLPLLLAAAQAQHAYAREVKAWSRVLSPQEVANYFATLTEPGA